MSQKNTCALLATFLLQPTLSLAAYTNPDTIAETATRNPQSVVSSLSAITVLERIDIDNSAAKDLVELLTIAGLDIATYGPFGKTAAPFIRGTNGDQVLVLVDGININSQTTGLSTLSLIPLSQIERIEIVRGAQSGLYGDSAVGGVIQIFTRQGSKEFQPRLRVGGGNYGAQTAEIGASGSLRRLTYSLHLTDQRSEGVNTSTTGYPDKDAFNNSAIGASFNYQFNSTDKLAISYLNTLSYSKYDGANNTVANDALEYNQQVLSIKSVSAPNDSWRLTLSLAGYAEAVNTLQDTVVVDNTESLRSQLTMQNDISLDDSKLLTLGIDAQVNPVNGTINYPQTETSNLGLFAQYQISFGQHNARINLRGDKHSEYNPQTSGGLAWGMKIDDQWRTSLNLSSAFKAPTFDQLYYPGSGTTPIHNGAPGNPDLKPESSQGIEGSVSYQKANLSAELHLYHTQVDDLIAYEFDEAANSGQLKNIYQASITGMELSVSTELKGWGTHAQLALVDPRDQSTDEILIQRSRVSASAVFQRKLGRFDFEYNIQAYGQRYDIDSSGERVTVPGFGINNLAVRYRLDNDMYIKADLSNLGDKDYQTTNGYHNLGRHYMAYLVYQP